MKEREKDIVLHVNCVTFAPFRKPERAQWEFNEARQRRKLSQEMEHLKCQPPLRSCSLLLLPLLFFRERKREGGRGREGGGGEEGKRCLSDVYFTVDELCATRELSDIFNDAQFGSRSQPRIPVIFIHLGKLAALSSP